MSDVGDAIDEARAEINSSASEFLPDICDLIELGLVDDGHSGKTEGQTTIATDIPCEVSEAAASGNTIIAGGVTYTGTHRLKFGWNATTVAINPTQQIVVHARSDEGQMIFEQPVREKGSMAVFVTCLAKLTTGFRSPSNV